ncbi:LOB domain-containing protein 22 [Nicotiana tomentosiformis]|uniref:LOB domain-containing protein 22 n=1 Tax=Nicotiana tomentosiformis TaxID=4098 RepID=UPI00051C34B5|nr:LOB domain-containing protein 22 [Nicotiana tomentosiformis]
MQNQMTTISTPIPNHPHTIHTTFTTANNLNHNYSTKRVNNNNNNNNKNKNVLLRVNGAGQACAACKYQRRKCAPDCVLAPYFPHDRQRQFLNAHKLFGVSNITKIIRHLDQPLKDEAMRTIIFQSDVRANDPVGGCYRIIRDLQRHIDYCKAELDIVLHQLAYCRAQAVAAAASEQQILADHHATEESFNDNNCDGVVNQADPLVNNNASSYDQQTVDYHPHSYYNHTSCQKGEDDQQYDEIQDGQLDLADINFPWSLHEQESTSTSAPNSLMKQLSVYDQCDNIKPILEGISGFGGEGLSFEHDQAFDQHSYSTREHSPIEGRE